jgi:hypothetical protein
MIHLICIPLRRAWRPDGLLALMIDAGWAAPGPPADTMKPLRHDQRENNNKKKKEAVITYRDKCEA